MPARFAQFLELLPRGAGVALALLALASGWIAAEPALLYLRVRSAPARPQPSLKERNEIATLFAGQAVEVLERSKDGDWIKVRWREVVPTSSEPSTKKEKKEAPAGEMLEGWVHATVLGERAPELEQATRPVWVKDGAGAYQAAERIPDRQNLAKAAAHAQARKLDAKGVLAAEHRYPAAREVEEFLRAGQLGLQRPDWPSLEEGVVP